MQIPTTNDESRSGDHVGVDSRRVGEGGEHLVLGWGSRPTPDSMHSTPSRASVTFLVLEGRFLQSAHELGVGVAWGDAHRWTPTMLSTLSGLPHSIGDSRRDSRRNRSGSWPEVKRNRFIPDGLKRGDEVTGTWSLVHSTTTSQLAPDPQSREWVG